MGGDCEGGWGMGGGFEGGGMRGYMALWTPNVVRNRVVVFDFNVLACRLYC